MSGHHLLIHLNQGRCCITCVIQVNPQMCPSVILSVAQTVHAYVSHMTCLSVNQVMIPPGSPSICQQIHPIPSILPSAELKVKVPVRELDLAMCFPIFEW